MPQQDPRVRSEAKDRLASLFGAMGRAPEDQGSALGGLAGGLGGQLVEFVEMPLELAAIFAGMGVEIAEAVLTSLAEAGYVLVKGLTPA